MIDISTEHLLSLNEAAKLRPLGRGNRPCNISTVFRWVKNGVKGVKLEALRLGGALYTSREAIQRFAERLTAGIVASPPGGNADPQKKSEGMSPELIEKELDRLGIK